MTFEKHSVEVKKYFPKSNYCVIGLELVKLRIIKNEAIINEASLKESLILKKVLTYDPK